LALRSGALQARPDSLCNSIPLELTDRREDVKLEPSGWGRGIDPFTQRHEANSERLEIVQQRNEMSEIAAEAIEPPANKHIKPTAPRVGEHLIKGRASILGSAETSIHELGSGPTPGLNVTPKFDQLVFAGLVSGADPSVDRRLHLRGLPARGRRRRWIGLRVLSTSSQKASIMILPRPNTSHTSQTHFTNDLGPLGLPCERACR
jgi:hypothetical protein